MIKKWLINMTEEPNTINATLDNLKEHKTNFYSLLVSFLCFKLLQKAKNIKVKFKLIPYQDLFHARSSVRDGESGIC